MPEMEAMEDQPNSVEISVNAKGLWSGKVKCYNKTLDGAYDEATKKAEDLAKLIAEKNK